MNNSEYIMLEKVIFPTKFLDATATLDLFRYDLTIIDDRRSSDCQTF